MNLMMLLCLIAAPSLPAAIAETIDGERIEGRLIRWDTAAVELAGEEGPRVIEIDKLLMLRLHHEQESASHQPEAWMELVDGSRLALRRVAVENGRAELELPWDGSQSVNIDLVASIWFTAPDSAQARPGPDVSAADVKADRLVLRVDQGFDYVDGIVKSMTGAAIKFELDGEVLDVPRAKVAGMIFFRTAGRSVAEPFCRVLCRGDCALVAQSVTFAGERLEIAGATGTDWSLAAGDVEALDFSTTRVVYLSDLAAETEEWQPYVGVPAGVDSLLALGRPRRDQGFDGKPLQLAGQECRKGWMLRSRSELVFRLPGSFRRFVTLAGMDDAMSGRGHVKLVVSGDGRTLYNEALSGRLPPKPVELDITGVKVLAILVDYGEGLDWSDRVVLCNARIVK